MRTRQEAWASWDTGAGCAELGCGACGTDTRRLRAGLPPPVEASEPPERWFSMTRSDYLCLYGNTDSGRFWPCARELRSLLSKFFADREKIKSFSVLSISRVALRQQWVDSERKVRQRESEGETVSGWERSHRLWTHTGPWGPCRLLGDVLSDRRSQRCQSRR